MQGRVLPRVAGVAAGGREPRAGAGGAQQAGPPPAPPPAGAGQVRGTRGRRLLRPLQPHQVRPRIQAETDSVSVTVSPGRQQTSGIKT